jgi:hypothetical protein
MTFGGRRQIGWLACLGLLTRMVFAQGNPAAGNPGSPWPAIDALGRSLPGPAAVGPPQPGRWVGVFYFLWHNEPGNRNQAGDGPYDISRILASDPEALRKPTSPLWGGIGVSHYWGEPLYGYYRSTDPWVLRRHARLLAEAGIDALIFDTTNARSYPDVYLKLCEVFREVRLAGGRTPQIVFMVNTKAAETAGEIYETLYKPGLFRELWFVWQNKPLMLCDPAQASAELRQFFTLRRAHWPFTLTNTPVAWHWEASYPQPYGYVDDPLKPEQVNVSVAQNLRQADGKVTNMSSGEARGRSFHQGLQESAPGAVNHGFNFQEQWNRAFELGAPFVMVTGWNEWIAGRWGEAGGLPVFVDQYNEEFSRDIEPMKGGHADLYYYQLVANVRRFKGVPPLPKPSPPKTINLESGFEQWREVEPEFRDDAGDIMPRNCEGVAGLKYHDATGRNDLLAAKVARDVGNIYFYVRTQGTISRPTGTNWMWLLIDVDQDPKTGWEGYDYLINRTVDSDGKTWLEKNAGGWRWEKVARLSLVRNGNELAIAVPRSALGLPVNRTSLALDFKWADNLQHPGDIMDFYLSGDTAPEGRFSFRFLAE